MQVRTALLVLTVVLCIGLSGAQITDEDEEKIRQKFETPSGALFLQRLPRYKGLSGVRCHLI